MLETSVRDRSRQTPPFGLTIEVAKEAAAANLFLLEPVLGMEHVDEGLSPPLLNPNIGVPI